MKPFLENTFAFVVVTLIGVKVCLFGHFSKGNCVICVICLTD